MVTYTLDDKKYAVDFISGQALRVLCNDHGVLV